MPRGGFALGPGRLLSPEVPSRGRGVRGWGGALSVCGKRSRGMRSVRGRWGAPGSRATPGASDRAGRDGGCSPRAFELARPEGPTRRPTASRRAGNRASGRGPKAAGGSGARARGAGTVASPTAGLSGGPSGSRGSRGPSGAFGSTRGASWGGSARGGRARATGGAGGAGEALSVITGVRVPWRRASTAQCPPPSAAAAAPATSTLAAPARAPARTRRPRRLCRRTTGATATGGGLCWSRSLRRAANPSSGGFTRKARSCRERSASEVNFLVSKS